MTDQIDIDIQELRKRKLMIGTPMYAGMCFGTYTKSSNDLAMLCTQYGITVKFFYLFNESLITRARNYIVDEFLRSDCTHLLFIDSDIGFNPHDVITLLAMTEPDSDKEIMCGPYPKKCISWEKVKVAVDKGFADQDPQILSNFVGDYVLNPVEGTTEIKIDEPVEVLEGGTGFMMIQRSAFEKYAKAYPEFSYKPDHIRTEAFDGSREIMAYFDTVIDNADFDLRARLLKYLEQVKEKGEEPVLDNVINMIQNESEQEYSKRYLSEDYMFCQWARKAGIKVWMCPWMELQHSGTMVFGGSLRALAAVGAAATADVGQLNKSLAKEVPVVPTAPKKKSKKKS